VRSIIRNGVRDKYLISSGFPPMRKTPAQSSRGRTLQHRIQSGGNPATAGAAFKARHETAPPNGDADASAKPKSGVAAFCSSSD
jgi:hypothetical protein